MGVTNLNQKAYIVPIFRPEGFPPVGLIGRWHWACEPLVGDGSGGGITAICNLLGFSEVFGQHFLFDFQYTYNDVAFSVAPLYNVWYFDITEPTSYQYIRKTIYGNSGSLFTEQKPFGDMKFRLDQYAGVTPQVQFTTNNVVTTTSVRAGSGGFVYDERYILG